MMKVVQNVLLSLILSILYLNISEAFPIQPNNVLILHSYNEEYEWTSNINHGIHSVLQSNPNIEIYTSYMDSRRFNSIEDLDNFYKFQLNQYKNMQFDAIIVSDNHALMYINKYGDKLFPNTPVVFCAVNAFENSMIENHNNYTGVVEETSYKETLDLALSIHKNIQNVAIVVSKELVGNLDKKKILELIPSYPSSISFHFIEDRTLQIAINSVAKLPSNSIVLYMGRFYDEYNNPIEISKGLSIFSNQINIPIYSFVDFFLGKGIVGGKLTSSFSQGESAAKLVLQIIDGTPPRKLPIITQSPNKFMFDYNVLQRFHIDYKMLPQNSTIDNFPQLFHVKYRKLIFAIIILGIFTLAAFIIIYNSRKKRLLIESTLQKSENMFRILFESSPLPICLVKNDIIQQVNSSFANLFNMDLTKLCGSRFSARLFPDISTIVNTKIKNINIQREEYSAIKKDGSTIPVLIKFTDVDLNIFNEEKEGDNNSSCILAFLMDLSQQKNHEEKLIIAKETAEQSNALKSKFLNNINHEIRNPLNAITGISNLLLNTSISIQQRNFIEITLSACRNLLTVLASVSDSFGEDLKTIDANNKQFQLKEELDNMESIFLQYTKVKNKTLLCKAHSDVPNLLIGDIDRIQLICLNFLELLSSQKDDIDLSIIVSLEKESNEIVTLRFTIAESSAEFNQISYIPSIDDITNSTTTLSLKQIEKNLPYVVAQELIQLLQGEFGMESRGEFGNSIWFTLNLLKNNKSSEKTNLEKTAVSQNSSIKILVVEDNILNQLVVINNLQKLGFAIDTADSGKDALFKINENFYNLILMDLQIPEISGLEVVKVIRKQEEYTGKHIPIIATTAFISNEDREQCLSAGMDDYLSKPYETQTFIDTINKHLLKYRN